MVVQSFAMLTTVQPSLGPTWVMGSGSAKVSAVLT